MRLRWLGSFVSKHLVVVEERKADAVVWFMVEFDVGFGVRIRAVFCDPGDMEGTESEVSQEEKSDAEK